MTLARGKIPLASAVLVALYGSPALAQDPSAPRLNDRVDPDLIDTSLGPQTTPPPLDIPYLQYGVAFTTEFVTSAGNMCPDKVPCILGSGGGVLARVGRRAAGPWYFGGAYELTKQDPGSLYRFATLQQLRIEGRWYVTTGLDTQPYATFGFGVAGYGNEWSIDTWGPTAFVGIGVESQLSRTTVVGAAIVYRAMGLRTFIDTSGVTRDASVAQVVGFELSLAERDPLTPKRGR